MSAPPDVPCPHCGAPCGADQEYCLACGLRLPSEGHGLARVRRFWVRRLGWYPGDWAWTTLAALLVAAVGAAVAVASTRSSEQSSVRTIVATDLAVPLREPTRSAATPTIDTSTLPVPPEPTTSAGAPPAPNGEMPWPDGQSGWTVVLVSLPETTGGATAAKAQAQRAVDGGLPEVGVLRTSRFSTLHPGYLAVFAGVYDTRAEAQSSLAAARSAGFAAAYVRQITR